MPFTESVPDLPVPAAPSSGLSDRAVSVLRTAVPSLWGALVAALLGVLAGHLPVEVYDPLAEALSSDLLVAVVVAAVIAAWYALWRRVEPFIPDWLTRVVLGSARTPAYAPTSSDGAAVVTSLDDTERTNLASLRDALDEGDPGRLALDRVLSD